MNSQTLNLDQVVNRSDVRTLKFDDETMRSIFGTADLWPSWVADMDFEIAKPITEAIIKRTEHAVYGYSGYWFSSNNCFSSNCLMASSLSIWTVEFISLLSKM